MLSTWDKQELEETLGQRVEFSKRAIGKLLQAFDRMLQRNEKLHKALENKAEKEKEDLLGQALKSGQDGAMKKEENEDDEKKGTSVQLACNLWYLLVQIRKILKAIGLYGKFLINYHLHVFHASSFLIHTYC